MRVNDDQLPNLIRDALDRRLACTDHTSGARQARILQKIKEEGEPVMKKKISLAAVLAAALVLLTIAAVAAGVGRNQVREDLEIGEKEEQWIEELGISTIGTSVTQNGVTVTCEEALVDRVVMMTALRVEGYIPPDGKQPGFDVTEILIDGVNIKDGAVGYSWSGGSKSIGWDENDKEIYLQEDGTWEWTISLDMDEPDQLFGKTVTIHLSGLGYYGGKASFTTVIEGEWDVEVTLGNAVTARIMDLSSPVGDTGAVVCHLELSPLSMLVEFEWPERYYTEAVEDGETGEVTEEKFLQSPAYFLGFELKNGSRMLNMEGGGTSGPIAGGKWKYTMSLARMIDPEEVTALLFQPWNDESGTIYVVPITEGTETAE